MCAKRKSQRDKKILFSDTFYSDMEADDMLYAKIIRAARSQGTITKIVLPELPDGCAFFSAKDIAGKKSVRTLGQDTPVFCTGDIAYKGEPIGILTGAGEQELELLARDIKILTEDEADGSPKEDAPQAPAAERTVRYGEQDDGAFEALFSQAAHVVDGVWNSTLHPVSYGEPSGAFVYQKGTSLHVCTSSQWLSHLRKAVADTTGTESDKIIITRTPVSDLNTNMLWRNAILASQAATAACRTGRPVKLVLSRAEQDTYIDNAAPVSVIYRTALEKNGTILAQDVTIDIDTGSRNPFAKEILDRIVIASCSVYRAKNLRIRAVARAGRRPPFSINLATIDSQAFFAIENQMQRISENTGFTPLELRLINYKEPNLKRNDSYPFLIPCGKMKETLEAVVRASDFLRKYTAYKLDESDRNEKSFNSPFSPPLRGTGLACAFHGCGYYGTNFSVKNVAVEATLAKDGALSVHVLPPSPAVWNIWKRIAKEILDIDERKFTLDSDFVSGTEPETPEIISNNIGMYTTLFQKCCKALRAKKDKEGALPATVKKVLPVSARSAWSKETFSGAPFYKTSFAAAVVELELNPTTYREQLRGIWIVVNGGKILDVRAAEGAVKTSVQQMLGALIEDDPIAYTNVRVQFVLSNEDSAPIGDIVPSVIPAAFSAALSQALAATITSLPIKTDTIYIISEQAKHAGAEASQPAETAETPPAPEKEAEPGGLSEEHPAAAAPEEPELETLPVAEENA